MRRAAGLIAAGIAASAACGMLARALVPQRGRMRRLPGAYGRRLRVIADGPPGAPLAVLVHGLGGQAENFAAMLPLLDGWRVLVPDRPGAGRSDPAAPGGTGLATQAAAIAVLIEAEATGPAIVVGHSLGGAVALQLAADRPDLVAGLILLAALTRPERPRLSRFAAGIGRIPPLREALARVLTGPALPFAGPGVARLAFAPEAMPPGFPRWGGGLLVGQPRAIAGVLRDLDVVARGIGALQPRLADLRMPVTALHGTHDKVLDPARHGRDLTRRVPHARLTLVQGAGHMLPVCHPALCVAAMEDLRAGPAGTA